MCTAAGLWSESGYFLERFRGHHRHHQRPTGEFVAVIRLITYARSRVGVALVAFVQNEQITTTTKTADEMSARRCICTFRLNGDRPTGERMENVASFSETVTRQTFNRHQTATLREKTVRESEEKKGLIHYLPSTDCGGCGFRDAKEVFSLQKRGKLFFKLTCLHSIRHC